MMMMNIAPIETETDNSVVATVLQAAVFCFEPEKRSLCMIA